jgi:crotonobetainyl-CoA:carnitine CoA-transferase CaiB-like acyl-CoA transferase
VGWIPGRREERPPTLNQYRTSDDRFISLVFVNDPDLDWVDLCGLFDRTDLAVDPRFATASARSEHRAAGVRILDEIFAQQSLEVWRTRLAGARGVWSAVQTPQEILDDPQTVANGFVRSVEDAKGATALPVPPVLFDEEAGDIKRAPDYCEHTDEVLKEAGFSAEEISRYRGAGVIA